MPGFAHTATGSGPNAEFLLLGIGMIVVSGIFFFQKAASPRVSLVLLVLGAAAVTGAFTFASSSGDDHREVAIAIAAPEQSATVAAGEPVAFEIELTGAVLASRSTSGEGGHLHVYVDGTTVGMPSTLDVELELEEGEHEVEVEYVDAGHRPLDPPVTDAITLTAE
jgi:hypothetical protein